MNRVIFKNSDYLKVFGNSGNWRTFTRKRYKVQIQLADTNREYNVQGKKGVVYNFLEESEETLENADYVVTGLLGEMWPIGRNNLSGYDIDPEKIGKAPVSCYTKISDKFYYAIQIPPTVVFQVVLQKYGVLNGNKHKANGDKGDWIICTSFAKGDYRIVNERVFEKMYQEEKRNV